MDAAWPWCMLVAYDPGPGVSCPLFVHHDLSHKEAGPLPERKLSGGSRGLGHGPLAQHYRPSLAGLEGVRGVPVHTVL